jgi:hypothetical protein
VKSNKPKSQELQKQSYELRGDQGLDLTVLLGTQHYVDLKGIGKGGRIQKLWERYCVLRWRIGNLKAEIATVEQELLLEEPSIFDTSHSLAGARSFTFRPKLGSKKTNPELAMRNAVILQDPSLTAKKTCLRLDSFDVDIPENWIRQFPSVNSWASAYAHRSCRPLVDRLISGVRAQADLL